LANPDLAPFKPGQDMRRIDLDTDIGGGTENLCALAVLLGWPGVELIGVTTCNDSGGMRAGLSRYALKLAGREACPSWPVQTACSGVIVVRKVFPTWSVTDPMR
jgi:hypothetical protein